MCEICNYLETEGYSKQVLDLSNLKSMFTEKKIKEHDLSWNSYSECWMRFKKWNEKQKIEKIKKELKLIQTTQGNCLLCAINSDWVNEGIFFRNWSSDEVKKELDELGFPIVVTDKEVQEHKKKHLSVKNKNKYDDKKYIKTVQNEIKKRNEINEIGISDLVNSQILTLTLDIRELETNNLTGTTEYKTKVELLKSFIDLKLKSEGGEVQDVNIVNFWEQLKERQ